MSVGSVDCCNILVGNGDGERSLGRSKRRKAEHLKILNIWSVRNLTVYGPAQKS